MRNQTTESPEDPVRFTMRVTSQFGLPYEPKPYHGQVFLLDEVPALVERYGLPDATADSDYAGYEHRTDEHYIEVQLWCDEPVLKLMATTRTMGFP